jgi:16S rRNA (guanine527-N7)-methyltransferase
VKPTTDTRVEGIEGPLWLYTVCKQNGLPLSDQQLGALESYVVLLLDWNRSVNLISRKDEGNIWQNHILHSLSILFKLSVPKQLNVLDLGTGGGLPGIPLKIVRPDLSFTLLDATRKKTDAVADMIAKLGLMRIEAVWGRAEDIGMQREHEGKYDFCVARAVAPLLDLTKWAEPFLSEPTAIEDQTFGKEERRQETVEVRPPALVALKGGDMKAELSSVRTRKSVQSVRVVDLTYRGSEAMQLSDKKIVYIQF